MTETTTTPTKYLKITRFLFYLIFIGVALQAIWLIVNAFYFSILPASDLHLINTGYSYRGDGLIGYFNYSFDALAFNIEVTNQKLFFVSSCIISFLSYSLPLLIIMYYARKLFKMLAHSYTPFMAETSGFIRKIGIGFIFMGIFSKLIFQISMNFINLKRLYFVNPGDFSYLLAGVLALLLADIFQKGYHLQQESDTTL